MSLEILLLGPPQLIRDDAQLALPGYRTWALLAYLIASGQPHSREQLTDLLFENPNDPQAALRWTLSKLRKVLGPGIIHTAGRVVEFDATAGVLVDLDQLAAGEPDVYRGEFLEGLHVQEARPFEAWLLVERERWRARAEEALEARLTSQWAAGDAAGMEKTAVRLLEMDDLREDWRQALIRAYAQQGKFEAALAQVELNREILRAEFDREPASQTEVLAATVVAQQAAVYRAAAGQVNELSETSYVPDPGGAGGEVGPHTAASRPPPKVLPSPWPWLAAVTVLLGSLMTFYWFNERRTAVAAVPQMMRFPAGTVVSVGGDFDPVVDSLMSEAYADFESRTGIDVQLVDYGSDVADVMDAVVASGLSPDVFDLPQPGYLRHFAAQGVLVNLRSFLDDAFLTKQYSPALLEAASVDGVLVAVWHSTNVKGLVWYPRRAFEEAGYEVPRTWEKLLALSDQMVADGRTPWCIGIESGGASGWVGTDWVENILLRTAAVDTYDAWVVGDLPFDSPAVRHAFEMVAEIWFADGYVEGGAAAIANTNVVDSALFIFEDPPRCFLQLQGSFMVPYFPPEARFGEDYDFFLLPPIDPAYGHPVLGGGDLFVMLHDRPEVREFVRFLATGESVRPFLEAGGVISPHRDAAFEWYASPAQLKIAQTLLEADTFRFDGSDAMPAEVGTSAFWAGVVDWVHGSPLDQVLREIDAAWPEE